MRPMAIAPDALRALVEELIPLNRYLGLRLLDWDAPSARVATRLELRPEYVGNPTRDMPHGGILSFMIDATSGAAAMLSLDDPSLADRIATVDMRVDYLKPARGGTLLATSEVMRSGRRVIVVRTDVHDDEGTLVALGSNVFNVVR